MRFGLLALLALGISCASVPVPAAGVRSLAGVPQVPPRAFLTDLPVPAPTWPLQVSALAPRTPAAAALVPEPWAVPSAPDLRPAAAEAPLAAVPGPLAPLPLPEVRVLPLALGPTSRSWTRVAQAAAALPIPSTPAAAAPKAAEVPKAEAKTDPKAEAKAKTPAVTPAAAAPVPAAKAETPKTAAAQAQLLPAAEAPEAADFQWQDVNAAAGDTVTLHFLKANWLYLDPPAQQKAVGFQGVQRDKDATTFTLKPLAAGTFVLEFQRQDLVNQTDERRKVRLTVGAPGTRTASTGTATAPQAALGSANTALEQARQLALAGKTAEAVKKLKESYREDDARMNLELAKLLDQSGQDDEALTYTDKNLSLPGTDFDGTLDLGTRLAASQDPKNRLPAYVKLWSAGTSAPAEDLYLTVFEALRTSKQLAQAKEWSGRYGLWYAAPKLKDRYLYDLGQLLEEPGDLRDVRAAWKAYDEVVRLYPLSSWWKAAGDRASYLNRHFLQVR